MMLHPHCSHPPSPVDSFHHFLSLTRSSRVLLPVSLLLVFLSLIYLLSPSSSLPSSLTTQTSTSPSGPIIAHHSALPLTPTSHSNPGLSKRVHIPPSVVPNLQQWAVARFEAGSRTERHVHESLTEVFHVKEGKGRFEFDGGRVEEVGVDDTIAVPAGAYHVVANEGTEVLVMVYASILI